MVRRVFDALERYGCRPKWNGNYASFYCPCHDDNNPSGSLKAGDSGKVLLVCGAQCRTEGILDRIGLKWADLFEQRPRVTKTIEAIYDYVDEDEALLFQVVRFRPKTFRQRRPDGEGHWVWGLKAGLYGRGKGGDWYRPRNGTSRPGAETRRFPACRLVPYRLPAVLATSQSGGTVYNVEGEKDADAINDADPDRTDYVATCNPMGANNWHDEYAEYQRGAGRAVVVQDKDDAGRSLATRTLASLRSRDVRCELVEAASGEDAYDHLEAGYGLDDFVPVESAAEEPEGYCWERVSFLEMVTAPDEPIEWRIEGIIAADEVGVVTGPPKDGKTWMLLRAVLDVARGARALDLFPVSGPCQVLWIDEEMGRRKIKRRLQRLCKGLGLSLDELRDMDRRLDIRPQQGLSLASSGCFEAFRRTIDSTEPGLIVMDSLTALSSGEENSATDRRRFYNTILAPIKATYGCAILITAHPPLPSREAHQDSMKRPRGSGDIIAQVDRALWMTRVEESKTLDAFTLTSTLEPYRSREGGDIEPALVTVDGLIDAPVTVRADYAGSTAGQRQLGKVHACQMEILKVLRGQADGRMYQPDLKNQCRESGYGSDTYYAAVRVLVDQSIIGPPGPVPGSGRSGHWVCLIEGTDE